MSSIYTDRNKIEVPATGELVDSWGVVIGGNFVRVDEALDGAWNVVVGSDVPMVYASDETSTSHYAMINITGGVGGRILMQAKQSFYVVRNGASGAVTFLIQGVSGGVQTTVAPGVVTIIMNDGVNSVHQLGFAGTPVKSYIDTEISATRTYIDEKIIEAGTADGELPAQSGNANKFMKTNGTNASWQKVTKDDVVGLADELKAAKDFAIAAAAVI